MKKRTVKALTGAIITTMLLAGCGVQGNNNTDVEIADQAPVEATSEAVIDSMEAASEDASVETPDNNDNHEPAYMLEGTPLTEDEMGQLQDFFNQPDNYGFTLSSYKTPDEIDWGKVFAYGAGIENCEYSQEALDAYLEADEYYDSVEYDVIALSGDDIRAFVETKTGKTDFDVASVDGFTYVESFDILFAQVSDTYDRNVSCLDGVKSGDSIQVVVEAGLQEHKRLITLKEANESDKTYQFCSNRELWEEDVEKTIEARNFDTDEKVTCAVVSTEKGLDIEVIEEDSVTIVAHPRFSVHETVDIRKYSDIKEIAFCDVDGDKLSDMVTVLSDGQESIAVLNVGVVDEDGFGYSIGNSAVTKWLSANVSDMNAENVIRYALDHQDELKNIVNN